MIKIDQQVHTKKKIQLVKCILGFFDSCPGPQSLNVSSPPLTLGCPIGQTDLGIADTILSRSLTPEHFIIASHAYASQLLRVQLRNNLYGCGHANFRFSFLNCLRLACSFVTLLRGTSVISSLESPAVRCPFLGSTSHGTNQPTLETERPMHSCFSWAPPPMLHLVMIWP